MKEPCKKCQRKLKALAECCYAYGMRVYIAKDKTNVVKVKKDFQQGKTIKQLAKREGLTERAIYKIISK